ncbi:MAG: CcmD family protein [Deferribacteraceae bacterium]|jgi:CcmD family protein|nr:CcmD family protein [Deferribacteraceae bacterium]
MYYMVAAYCVIWLVLGVYIFNISARLKKLEQREEESRN